MLDGKAWRGRYDMAWKPVFSPDGKCLAARVRTGSKYAVIVNDKQVDGEFDKAWDPTFSPDGSKVLIRGMRNNTLLRIVADVPR
jgi:Tol biopolymer transport system component